MSCFEDSKTDLSPTEELSLQLQARHKKTPSRFEITVLGAFGPRRGGLKSLWPNPPDLGPGGVLQWCDCVGSGFRPV